MNYAEIFYWIINTSIKGSFLVMSILLVKLLFRDKLGAKWHYYIWFLLLARLIIPVVPRSSISIFNLFSISNENRLIFKSNVSYSPAEIASWFKFDFYENGFAQSDSLTSNALGLSKYISMLLQEGIETKLVLTWLIIGIGLLILILIANVRFRLHVNKYKSRVDDEIRELLVMCRKKMRIKKDLHMIHTKAVKAPALYGLVRPCILLPIDIDKQVEKEELEYILLHELSHFKRRDIAVFWIMTMIKVIYWFNPIIWYGLNQMRQDCEISCDALALSYINSKDCRKYGQTIIHLLQNTTKPLKNIGIAGMLGSKHQLKRRIKMITLFKKNKYKLSILSISILVLMGFVFLTNAKEETILDTRLEGEVTEIQVNETEAELDEETTKAMVWPLPSSNTITSSYGIKVHPVLKVEKKHTGIDIAGKEGDSIIAAADGVVTLSKNMEAYGNAVIIDHGNGVVSLYAHCSELLVEKDKKVKAGDEIAKVGSTGYSTGPHLHFEIRKDGEDVDPFDGYLDKKDNE